MSDGEPVERLIEFIDCESVSGESICENIIQALRKFNLQPELCRAQTYDGAGSMAGRLNGCAARFQREIPEAVYYHCASHQLNLTLSKTSNIKEIQLMLNALTSVGLFFKYSPKCQRQLEKSIDEYNTTLKDADETRLAVKKTKLKTMCQTRWVERHSSMEDFDDMYTACLEDIASNNDSTWDGKTVSEAHGLLHLISTPGFIAAFRVNYHMFGYTKGLSSLLQGSTMDVLTAYNEIHLVKKIFITMRKNAEKEFKPIFDSMLAMAEVAGSGGMPVPRTCLRQTARSNVQASSPEEYWCRTVYVPFLDHLIQGFDDRFNKLSPDTVRGLKLLPTNVSKLSPDDTTAILQRFRSDLPSPGSFTQKIRMWKLLWSGLPTDLPSTLKDTLTSDHYSPKSYPNIMTILHILSITPVTVASTERQF